MTRSRWLRWQRLIDRLMPWYDTAAEVRRTSASEARRKGAVADRIDAERVRESYREYAQRVARR